MIDVIGFVKIYRMQYYTTVQCCVAINFEIPSISFTISIQVNYIMWQKGCHLFSHPTYYVSFAHFDKTWESYHETMIKLDKVITTLS